MSPKKLFHCFISQYSVSLLAVLSLTYVSSCFDCYISSIGKFIVLAVISWSLANRCRKHFDKEVVSSFKRAILVTGCDSGFGNALAFKLNENGYRVYATVLDPKSDGAQKLLTGSRFDGKTHIFKMNVTDGDEVQSVYDHVKNDLRKNGEELWAVVNNAGIIAYGPFDWGTIETYKQVFDVNTLGMVWVTRTFLPLLRQSKGRIVNLVSMAGRATSHNLPSYSMSKHASISFSDAIRRELKKYGIKVSTVEPMAYKTQMGVKEYYDTQLDRLWAQTSDQVQRVYGPEYLQNLKDRSYKATVVLPPGDDIYEVIDILVEAVRSPEPRIRYEVIANHWLVRLGFGLIQKLPMEVQDALVLLGEWREAVKPAYLRKEE